MPDHREASPEVVVEGDTITVNGLVVREPDLATYVSKLAAEERGAVIGDACKVGLIAFAHAAVSLDADIVRAEFEKHFAASGTLARILDAYLGERGAMAQFIDDLANPKKRQSVISQLSELLNRQFVGEDAELMKRLQPQRESSPLHPMYVVLSDLKEAVLRAEGFKEGKAVEKARGTAKGTEFEDLVEPPLGTICAATGTGLERTTTEIGDAGTKDGDFVVTLNRVTGGEPRIVIETRNKKFNAREIAKDLADARRNRDALVGVAIYAPGHLPVGYGPVSLCGTNVIAEFNPDEPENIVVLELALGVARVLAAIASESANAGVNAKRVQTAIRAIVSQVETFRRLQVKLTTIGTAATEIKAGLKAAAQGILESVAAVEEALGDSASEQ